MPILQHANVIDGDGFDNTGFDNFNLHRDFSEHVCRGGKDEFRER